MKRDRGAGAIDAGADTGNTKDVGNTKDTANTKETADPAGATAVVPSGDRPEHVARTQAWGDALAGEDFVLVSGDELTALLQAGDLDRLASCWESLELDRALVDGGVYRYRRYGRLRAEPDPPRQRRFTCLPYTPFRQSAEHIPAYGGRQRIFGPVPEQTLLDPTLLSLLGLELDVVERATGGPRRWEIGLHMVRVIAVPGTPGNPTPEGRHRDGHDFVGMHLFGRTRCAGGESTLYLDGRPSVRSTLTGRLDSLIVADDRLTHEVSPVVADGGIGVRDMLLVDLNAR